MNSRELGEAVARLRKEAGYTQQQLADYTGISRVTLSAFENGSASDFGVKKLLRVLDILGHRIEVLEPHPLPTLDDLARERRASR